MMLFNVYILEAYRSFQNKFASIQVPSIVFKRKSPGVGGVGAKKLSKIIFNVNLRKMFVAIKAPPPPKRLLYVPGTYITGT